MLKLGEPRRNRYDLSRGCLRDLSRSPEPRHAAELAKWKAVMGRQFLEEGRDRYGFVSPDGKRLLGSAHRNLTGRSPNYPGFTPDTPTRI